MGIMGAEESAYNDGGTKLWNSPREYKDHD